MDKVFFKIIIPNYNNMPYIKRCLDSILNQTFQDFKIVIVDDLSTDMSDKFCQMYARKYPKKIHFVQATEKRYAGGCRNIGIDFPLDCEYYMYVDGDDYLYSKECLSILYHATKDFPGVIVWKWVIEKNGTITSKNFIQFEKLKNRLANGLWGGVCGKAIHSKYNQKFLEKCCHGEDTYQWLKVMDQNPVVKQIDYVIYVYNRYNPNGTINQKTNYLKTKSVFYAAIQELSKIAKTDFVKQSIQYRIQHQL